MANPAWKGNRIPTSKNTNDHRSTSFRIDAGHGDSTETNYLAFLLYNIFRGSNLPHLFVPVEMMMDHLRHLDRFEGRILVNLSWKILPKAMTAAAMTATDAHHRRRHYRIRKLLRFMRSIVRGRWEIRLRYGLESTPVAADAVSAAGYRRRLDDHGGGGV
mmetsp:Transcript_1327/g.3019  ORF Transcript_1327/g.3019 Transcript_1327/m.3019 type:complete len:160 (-) Transcript_1327:1375-1854(-)